MKTLNQKIEQASIDLELEEVLNMLGRNATTEEIRDYVKGELEKRLDFDKPYRWYTIGELLDFDPDEMHSEYLQGMRDADQDDMDYRNAVFSN